MAGRRSIKRTYANWLIRVPERVAMTLQQLTIQMPFPTADDEHDDVVPVYVIHWNAPEWCLRTVRSLLASEHQRVAVTIVDNGGLPAGFVDQIPGVDVICTGANLGFTGGANVALAAWRRTSSPVAVIACHDVELHPEALSLLVSAVRAPGVGIAGCSAIGGDRPTSPAPPLSLVLDNVSWVGGALMVFNRDCVDAVGRFDERLGSYAEDVDYCWRATDAGWGVVAVPGITARAVGQVAENPTLLTHVNSLRMVRFRRGRVAFALRLVTEVGMTAWDGLRLLLPDQRRRARRLIPVHLAAFAELPLLWRRVGDDGLRWPQ